MICNKSGTQYDCSARCTHGKDHKPVEININRQGVLCIDCQRICPLIGDAVKCEVHHENH